MDSDQTELARNFRVAAFQRAPAFGDMPGTTRRIWDDMQWCATQGVDLAVFPECFLQRYMTYRDVIAGRAIAAEGPELTTFAATFAHLAVALIVGFIERRSRGFYNSAALICGGKVVGVYAKNHPNEQAFLAGETSPVFRIRDLTFGINICADANFSASARRLRDQGAHLICYPLNNLLEPETADLWRERSIRNLQARAVETGCWVVSSDVVGRHGGKRSHGCTCIVRSDGVVAARVAERSEGVISHDIE